MAAYFVLDIKVNDPNAYKEYAQLAGPSIQLYGGKALVLGGSPETIEGDWHAERIVVLEFADAEQFKRWYHSPEYSKIVNLRLTSTVSKSILVQGL